MLTNWCFLEEKPSVGDGITDLVLTFFENKKTGDKQRHALSMCDFLANLLV